MILFYEISIVLRWAVEPGTITFGQHTMHFVTKLLEEMTKLFMPKW
jgi:hypothetical protein